MKNTLKVFLVIALFCSSAFAEGDMGAGGLWSEGNTTTSLDGDMGAGGRTCPQGQTCLLSDESNTSDDSTLASIVDYLASILG